MIAVIGAFGIDTNVFSGSEVYESSFSTNIDYPGQAGNYCAHVASSIGLDVTAVAALGDDIAGDWVFNALVERGVNVVRITDPLGTKRSVNLIRSNGTRLSFYDGRGSMDLRPNPQDPQFAYIYSAQFAHLNIVNWSRYFIKPLKEAGIPISVDLQDVTSPGDEYRVDYVKDADVIFFSAVNQSDINEFIKRYRVQNPSAIIIVGKGADGARVVSANEDISLPAVSGAPIVDTTGAGDSLAMGFLRSYFIDGYSLKDSLLRGQITARHTCTVKSSIEGLISKQELEERYILIKQNSP